MPRLVAGLLVLTLVLVVGCASAPASGELPSSQPSAVSESPASFAPPTTISPPAVASDVTESAIPESKAVIGVPPATDDAEELLDPAVSSVLPALPSSEIEVESIPDLAPPLPEEDLAGEPAPPATSELTIDPSPASPPVKAQEGPLEVVDTSNDEAAAGPDAPLFTLPSVTGEEVSLDTYRGEKNVILIFYRAFW